MRVKITAIVASMKIMKVARLTKEIEAVTGNQKKASHMREAASPETDKAKRINLEAIKAINQKQSVTKEMSRGAERMAAAAIEERNQARRMTGTPKARKV